MCRLLIRNCPVRCVEGCIMSVRCPTTRGVCECQVSIEGPPHTNNQLYLDTCHCGWQRRSGSEKRLQREIEWQRLRDYHGWVERQRQRQQAHDDCYHTSIDWNNRCQCAAYRQATNHCIVHREPRLDRLLPCDRAHACDRGYACDRVNGHELAIQRSTLHTAIKSSSCASSARQGRVSSVESGRCGRASCASACRH